MNNLVVRAEGERQLVLVRCAECHELVARYELSNYYHHGKSFESWLRHVALDIESVIDLRDTYHSIQSRAQDELARAMADLESKGKTL